jgi:phage FluMu protein Com
MMSVRTANVDRAMSAWSRESVRCPSCGLVLTRRAPALAPHHCPRCLAWRSLAVELEHNPVQRPAQSRWIASAKEA